MPNSRGTYCCMGHREDETDPTRWFYCDQTFCSEECTGGEWPKNASNTTMMWCLSCYSKIK